MIEIGKYNQLTVSRFSDPGAYLEDDEENEILLPNKYVSDDLREDDKIEVFVYKDSEDRPVATTLNPYVVMDEFAYLEVRDVSDVGAFLDWGLEKDLLVPFREQSKKMEVGKRYFVFVYFDYQSERIVASGKIGQFTRNEFIELEEDDEVDLMVCNKTELGVNVIINNLYEGLIYHNEIFRPINAGDKIKGYIKAIRDDDKIDVSLEKYGYDSIEPNAQLILNKLKFEGGFLALSDKSNPELIKDTLQMSKKSFKKSIGSLYKQKLISIEDDGIRLIP